MADGHGGVRVQQQQSQRLPDDIAASDDHGMFSGDWDFVAPQHFNNAGGCAGARGRNVCDEISEIEGMKTVRVLVGREARQHPTVLDLRRHGGLHQEARDFPPFVEAADDGEKIVRREIGGRRDFLAMDAEFGASPDLVAHIDLGCGIVADENDSQPGWPLESCDARLQAGENLVAHQLAVEGLGAHLSQGNSSEFCALTVLARSAMSRSEPRPEGAVLAWRKLSTY